MFGSFLSFSSLICSKIFARALTYKMFFFYIKNNFSLTLNLSSFILCAGVSEEGHHEHRRILPLRQGRRLVQARTDQVQAVQMGQALQMSR